MARSLSLYRRRAGIIDLTLPVRAGVASYNFQFATNFDGSYTTFQNVPSNGLISTTASDPASDSSGFRGLTRFLFNPADYTAAFPTLLDTVPLWIKIVPISTAGVTGTAEAGQLILPYSSTPDRPVNISGSAPSAVSIAGSLEIQLPRQCRNLQIQNNDTTNPMFVAFEPGGSEFEVFALASKFTNFGFTYPVVTQLFVRGSGGTVTFNATMSIRNNPIG